MKFGALEAWATYQNQQGNSLAADVAEVLLRAHGDIPRNIVQLTGVIPSTADVLKSPALQQLYTEPFSISEFVKRRRRELIPKPEEMTSYMRKRKTLSAERLASRAGISRAMLESIEREYPHTLNMNTFGRLGMALELNEQQMKQFFWRYLQELKAI